MLNKIPSNPGPSCNQSRESDLSSKTELPTTGRLRTLRSKCYSPAEIKPIDKRIASRLSSKSTAHFASLTDSDLGGEAYKILLKFLLDSKKIKSINELSTKNISFNECFDNNTICELAKLLSMGEVMHIALSNNIHQLTIPEFRHICAKLLHDIPDAPDIANIVLNTIKRKASSNASLFEFILSLKYSKPVNIHTIDRT